MAYVVLASAKASPGSPPPSPPWRPPGRRIVTSSSPSSTPPGRSRGPVRPGHRAGPGHPCGRRAPSARPRHVRGPYAAAAVRRSARGGRRRRRRRPPCAAGTGGGRSGRCRPRGAAGCAARVLSSLGADVLVDCGASTRARRRTTSSPRPTSWWWSLGRWSPRSITWPPGCRPAAQGAVAAANRRPPLFRCRGGRRRRRQPAGALPVDDRAAAPLTVGRSDELDRPPRLLATPGPGVAEAAGWLRAADPFAGGAPAASAGERPRAKRRPRRRRPDPVPAGSTHRGPSTFAGSATRSAGEPPAQGAGA